MMCKLKQKQKQMKNYNKKWSFEIKKKKIGKYTQPHLLTGVPFESNLLPTICMGGGSGVGGSSSSASTIKCLIEEA